uniref:Reverse transcriptase domain-containing protein n=1 Tax=Tanacetum cinerariifolium TaxID=118510 RepID=A0A699GZA3_TANCI|nr:reverse transcriptase domain-containing protein [Tanacetum cinerariifolium]
MTPIIKCLEEEIWSEDENKARDLRMKIRQYIMEEGVLFKKSYLSPMLRCVGPLQANYVIREVHERACGMHSEPGSVMANILRLGLTRVIVTDNGTQLINDPFKSWCDKLKIKQMNMSVAHPQANSLVERANKLLMHGLKARLGQERARWVDELPNTEICMPAFWTILFNEARNEEEMRLNLDLIQERRETSAIQKVKYKKKVKQYYNKRVRPVSFRVGDFVYRRNEASRVENQGKLG